MVVVLQVEGSDLHLLCQHWVEEDALLILLRLHFFAFATECSFEPFPVGSRLSGI